MKHIETKHYTRISKKAAKKLYDTGVLLHIVPCNMDPESVFYNYHVQKFGTETFEKVVNAYEIYNCFNAQTGKYAAFYIKKPGNSFWQVYECRDTFGGLYASVITEMFVTEKPVDRHKVLSGNFSGYGEYFKHFDTETEAREYLQKIRMEG